MTRTQKIFALLNATLAGLGAITSLAGVESLIGRTTMAWLLLAYVGLGAAVNTAQVFLHIAPPGFELTPKEAPPELPR